MAWAEGIVHPLFASPTAASPPPASSDWTPEHAPIRSARSAVVVSVVRIDFASAGFVADSAAPGSCGQLNSAAATAGSSAADLVAIGFVDFVDSADFVAIAIVVVV